jgi:SanA protein
MKVFQRLAGSTVVLFVGLVLAILVINSIVYLQSRPHIYTSVEDASTTHVVLIPGAPLIATGVLSSIFIDRIDTAIALYASGKVQKILVSGDNSTVEHNEVNPVQTYLLEHGIPGEDIFLDHAGFDTYSSLYRARDIFGVTSVIIASQSFHLPRAVFIARNLGLEAYGIRADVGDVLLRNYVREVLANEKAFFDLFVHTKPKFLGEPIPITGDGRNYP